MNCHIIHLAVQAERKPFLQTVFCTGKIGVADTYGLESELMSPSAYLCGERGIIYLLGIYILHGHNDSRISMRA